MRQKIIIGLILGLLVIAGCSGQKREDSKTEVKMALNGDFSGSHSQSGISVSDQRSSNFSYNILLKVTGPNLGSPLLYYNLDYQLGSDWTCLVPNGNGMVFDVIVYSVYKGPASTNYFNFYAYIPDSPPEQRTYDLTGSPLTISLSLTESETAYIGSTGGGGAPVAKELPPFPAQAKLAMDTGSGKVPVPICNFVLQAYLIDPEFPDLVLGPALIDMYTASYSGYYYLGNIPVNRRYQAKVVRPEMGWEGYSDFFTLPDRPGQLFPVNITLNGFQPLKAEPKDFPVKDGDTTFKQTLSVNGGWGNWYYSHTLMFGSTLIKDQDSLTYRPTTWFGYDFMDTISFMDSCGMMSTMATAWWYKAPMISSYSPNPICSQTGGLVDIYGDNFDGQASPGPLGPSTLFLEGVEQTLSYGTTTLLEFDSPGMPGGKHTLRVTNPRQNPQIPDFKGWSDSINLNYDNSACGGW